MDNSSSKEVASSSIRTSAYDFDNARPATASEEFFVVLAEERIKATTPYLNDFLQKLITLNLAIIGAALVAAKEHLVATSWGIVSIIFLFMSLGTAVWGVCPRQHTLPMYCAKAIEIAERSMIRRKSIIIRAALIVLLLSIALLICGFVAVKPSS